METYKTSSDISLCHFQQKLTSIKAILNLTFRGIMKNEKRCSQQTKLYRHMSVALRASCQKAKLIKKAASCLVIFFFLILKMVRKVMCTCGMSH